MLNVSAFSAFSNCDLTEPATACQPPPLRAGDRVVLFAPASHQGRGSVLIEQALTHLRSWGLKAEAPASSSGHLYLAGPDNVRADIFQRLYLQSDIKALFATRGGWGSARMLDYLDATSFGKASPKWVVGMSDITALLCWLRRYANLATLHAPCLATTQLLESPHCESNLAHLRHVLFHPQQTHSLNGQVLYWPKGTPALIKSELSGGCLSILATGMGTPWQVHTNKTCLFLEDTDEAPYRIDRYFTQLRQAGVLANINAILLGHFQHCDTPLGLLSKLWQDLFAELAIPVIHQLPAGHGSENMALPLGSLVTINAPIPEPAAPCTILF